jgi:hypothetical protein
MTSREALLRSLAAIRTECLPAYIQLLDALQGLAIDCDIGQERFCVFGSENIVIGEIGLIPPSATVRCTRKAILAIIDGDLAVLDAVKKGQLDIRADIPILLRLAQAQRAFAEGAARARSTEDVLARYRIAASEAA